MDRRASCLRTAGSTQWVIATFPLRLGCWTGCRDIGSSFAATAAGADLVAAWRRTASGSMDLSPARKSTEDVFLCVMPPLPPAYEMASQQDYLPKEKTRSLPGPPSLPAR